MKTFKGIALLLVMVAVVSLVFAVGWQTPSSELAVSYAKEGSNSNSSKSHRVQTGDSVTSDVLTGNQAQHEDKVPAEMRAQLADIANAYTQNARYPDYAKPLNSNDWQFLHPQALVPRKAALANVPNFSATVILDRYIIDRSVEQAVQVQLSAESGFDNSVSVTGINVWLQQNAKRSPVMALAGSGQVFSGVLPVASLRAVPQGETAVMAQLIFSHGEKATVNAMVKLYEPEARLVRLGDTQVDGADLLIPVYFEVNKAGSYLVAANLFSADGTEPVSHLSAEMTLSPDNKSGLLKVHAATLRAKQAAGPYLLKDFDITRLPDSAGELTTYGSSKIISFAVRGFPLDSYSNEPYNDPAAQQKLEFLQKLATAK